MDNLPTRKNIRLKEYDYSKNGAYFITICAKNSLNLFASIDNVGAASCRPHLTNIGQIIENEISVLANTYHGVSVDCSVIMPNHVHMIISICNNDGRQNAAPTISQMINQWKRAISIKVGYSVWQKSFYDRIIRNEADYLQIWQYIIENPITWNKDEYYMQRD